MKNYLFLIGVLMLNGLAHAQKLPWVLEPTNNYTPTEPFSEGYSVVKLKSGKNWVYHYIDRRGFLSEDRYEMAHSICHQRSAVKKSGIWKYRFAPYRYLPGEYLEAFDFSGGCAAAKSNHEDKWGMIDSTGKTIVDFKYDGLTPFSDGWATGELDRKYVILNAHGTAIARNHAYIGIFSENRALFTNGQGLHNDIGYLDSTGLERIPMVKGRFWGSSFVDGLAAVVDTFPNLKYIDLNGKTRFWFGKATDRYVKDEPYEIEQHQFSNGFAAVKTRAGWGFIDTMGKWVIQPRFQKVRAFSDQFAAVQLDGKWTFVDRKNNILPFELFEEVLDCTEGVAWVRTNAGWGLLQLLEMTDILWSEVLVQTTPFSKVSVESTKPIKHILLTKNGHLAFEKSFTNPVFKWDTLLPLEVGKMVYQANASVAYNDYVQDFENQMIRYYQKNDGIPYYALLIGNSAYRGNGWGHLDGQPVKDADSLAAILYQDYGFQNVQVLHNTTLSQLKRGLQTLTERTDPKERTLLFYAGHGDLQKPHGMNYLVPVDAMGQRRNTQLSSHQFVTTIKNLRSKHFLFIIDACFGGDFVISDTYTPVPSVLGSSGDKASRGSKTEEQTAPEVENTGEKLVARVAMTSGQSIEVPNSSFFIEKWFLALHQNTQLLVTADALLNGIKEIVKKESGLVPQIGKLSNVGHEGGEFIFRKVQKGH